MWPKMLFELLPHFARLMPMADKYLSTRSASDKAQEAALAVLAADVRGELGRATETQAGICRQLQEQTAQLGGLAVDVTRTRMGMESVETRVAKLEQTVAADEEKLSAVARLLSVAIGMMVIAVALLVVLVVRVMR
jgi:chromosome segregation ATPase